MFDDFPFFPRPFEEGEEPGAEKSLRPRTLEEFVGQQRIVENLRLAILTSQARQEALDHVLLLGLPGLGKTTLAYLIAAAFRVRPFLASGPNLERGKDIVGLLTNLGRGDFLFIDEIHRMSAQAEEYLYSAMEDYCVDVVIDQGADARTVRLKLQPFTLVGATTRAGLLSSPFLGRFQIVEKLEPYPAADLERIIRRSSALLGCTMDVEASRHLSERCRGTPRYANRFLRRIRDVAQARAGWKEGDPLHIDMDAVREGLDRLGVDHNGLDRVDRKILDLLISTDGRPMGIKTIAATIGEEERTIEDVYEPYLIRESLLEKTPRGRRATAKAFERYRGGRTGELG